MDNKILGFVNFIRRKHPLPQVDPEWVRTIARLLEEAGQPVTSLAVYNEYLSSDLAVSALPLPALPLSNEDEPALLFPQPMILQLEFVSEIGSSAFHLLNTVEQRRDVLEGRTRIRRMDDDDDEQAIEAGKLPSYPRGMLKLELSDGRQSWHAMEYRRLDGLRLGETALGTKLQLHNVKSSSQLLFLSPENTQIIGGEVAALQVNQAKQFVNSLKLRMGKPIDEDESSSSARRPQPPPPPPRGTSRGAAPVQARHRAPAALLTQAARPVTVTAPVARPDPAAAAAARRAAILAASADGTPHPAPPPPSASHAGPSRPAPASASRPSRRAALAAGAKVEQMYSQPVDWMEDDDDIEYVGSGPSQPIGHGASRHTTAAHRSRGSAQALKNEEDLQADMDRYDPDMLDDGEIEDYDFSMDESFLAHVDNAEALALSGQENTAPRATKKPKRGQVETNHNGFRGDRAHGPEVIEVSD